MIYVLRDSRVDYPAADSNVSTIGMLEVYQSLIWNIEFQGQSYFELVTAYSEENIRLLKEGSYLVREIDWKNDEMHNVMAIQTVIIEYDIDNGIIMRVIGKGLKNDLFRKRVLTPAKNLKGNAETQIRNLITSIFITTTNRLIPGFGLDSAIGFTNQIDVQVLGENFAEWLEEKCREYGWGWDVYIKYGSYHFAFLKGEDRSVSQSINMPIIFSKEFDNLYKSTYQKDVTNFKNMVYIYGEEYPDDSPNAGKRKNTYYPADNQPTGFNRFEKYIDSSLSSKEGDTSLSEQEYREVLRGEAKQELNQQKLLDFTAEIESDGIYKLNKDYFLGDIVTVKTEIGINANARIIGIVYAEDENGINSELTFSEWEVIQ
ncbi:MAG: siphovirus ReqiPepy6 Gp37-like family protein [Eubacterium sp.]|nr:siphovirus ReqiPepy6 Gp37-like family protein [Eubacterium sp.]